MYFTVGKPEAARRRRLTGSSHSASRSSSIDVVQIGPRPLDLLLPVGYLLVFNIPPPLLWTRFHVFTALAPRSWGSLVFHKVRSLPSQPDCPDSILFTAHVPLTCGKGQGRSRADKPRPHVTAACSLSGLNPQLGAGGWRPMRARPARDV